jgi:tRNA A-37 threonylcarbamoyl transferase component Bud32
MNAEPTKICPKCQGPIPPEAPQGLCPKCVLDVAATATEVGRPAAPIPPPPRETIAAAFPQLEIIELIGQGGMGLVYKARQPKLDRFVALKLLPLKPNADPAFSERFNREARALARLNHPNIVSVHDFGQAANFCFLLMEFVNGVNLRQAMRAGRFTPTQALAIVPRICDALQYAHEEGVLHRDIKPENLLLDARGRIKIADFGIAKLLGDDRDVTLTASGAAIGTPHYMAPEQIERPHEVDQRADVYSLGVVFYEMLTGELPIGRFAPPSEKSAVDVRVDDVVMRALEKERERRFQSAGEVKTQVENITANPMAATRPADPAAAAVSGRWSGLAMASALLVGISLADLVLAVMFLSEAHGEVHINGVRMLLLIGGPAFAGTLLGWAALARSWSTPRPLRGVTVAAVTAVLWPLLLLNAACYVALVVVAKNLSRGTFDSPSVPVPVMVTAAGGAVGLLVFDVFWTWRWARKWRYRQPPLVIASVFDSLPRVPRWAAWVLGICLLLFFLLFVRAIFFPWQYQPAPPAEIAYASLSGPPGYELAAPATAALGNGDRLYRSSLAVPPGYVLTVTISFCSNQTVMPSSSPPQAAFLVAPGKETVQGSLTWRLLGNSVLADGAPMEFALGVEVTDNPQNKSFHVIPPEPIAVNLVSEPPQIWPPQNGHSKFLLIQGFSNARAVEGQRPTEWAVGVEVRLDPIPASLYSGDGQPWAELGTNWTSAVKAPPTLVPPSTSLEPSVSNP